MNPYIYIINNFEAQNEYNPKVTKNVSLLLISQILNYAQIVYINVHCEIFGG